MTVNHELKRV